MINIFWVVIALFLSPLHPFHVSVCDIEYNEHAKSIQLSQRVFLDDLETTLNEKYEAKLIIDEISTVSYRDSLIQLYLLDNLHLVVDGKKSKLEFVGCEIEEDAMWCYLEFPGLNSFKSMEINSTLLLEIFENQANIIHFSYKDYEKSIKLDKSNTRGYFTVKN